MRIADRLRPRSHIDAKHSELLLGRSASLLRSRASLAELSDALDEVLAALLLKLNVELALLLVARALERELFHL